MELLIIYIFLLISVFLEILNSDLKDLFFKSGVIILCMFLFFRYGQGVDYFNYIYAFKSSNDAVSDFIKYGSFSNRFEIGFSWISYFFLTVLKIRVEILISIFSIIAFLPVALFIKKYSNKPNLAIFYYFSFFFLIYSYSGIRQGVCISLFTFYLLPLLFEKKMTKYYLGVALLVLIHNSAMLLFILPFLLMITLNRKIILVYLLISLVIGIVIMPIVLSIVFPSFGTAGELVNQYSEKKNSGFDVLSLLIRLMIYIPIYYYYFEKRAFKVEFMKFLFNVYTFSLIFYFLFAFNSLLSSRFSIYFRLMEPVLLTNIFVVNKVYNSIFLKRAFVLLISIIMYIKSVQTELLLGEYKKNLEFYEIPYVTLFNKKEIFKYRNVSTVFYSYLD